MRNRHSVGVDKYTIKTRSYYAYLLSKAYKYESNYICVESPWGNYMYKEIIE